MTQKLFRRRSNRWTIATRASLSLQFDCVALINDSGKTYILNNKIYYPYIQTFTHTYPFDHLINHEARQNIRRNMYALPDIRANNFFFFSSSFIFLMRKASDKRQKCDEKSFNGGNYCLCTRDWRSIDNVPSIYHVSLRTKLTPTYLILRWKTRIGMSMRVEEEGP